MSTNKNKNGKGGRDDSSLSHEAVKLLKTQDAGYLRTMRERTRREREELEKEVVLDGVGVGDAEKNRIGSKVVFVGDREEQRAWGDGKIEKRRPSHDREDDDEDAGSDDSESEPVNIHINPKIQKSRKAMEAEAKVLREERAMKKRRRREQDARRAKLEALRIREKDLADAEEELDLQRAKMSHSVGGVNKNGTKFKVKERKR